MCHPRHSVQNRTHPKITGLFFLLLSLSCGSALPLWADEILPPRLHAHAVLLSQDQEAATKFRFALSGEPRLTFAGDWKSVLSDDGATLPSQPAIQAIISFQAEDSIEVLDGDRVLAGESGPENNQIRIYETTFPLSGMASQVQLTFVPHTGEVVLIHLTITLETAAPVILADPACLEDGINAMEEPGGASQATVALAEPAPVIFLRCAKSSDGIDIKLWSWAEWSWLSIPPNDSRAVWEKNSKHPMIHGHLPLLPAREDSQPFKFQLARSGGDPAYKQPPVNLLLLRNEPRALTWSVNATLGPTFSSYNESVPRLPEVHISQIGLTGKAQAQFRIIPPRWDAALSAFGTLLPLSENPGSMPGARWFGLNVRGGYTFSLDQLSRNTLSLMPGLYFWTMFVPGDQYGIQNLNGPQLVLAYGHASDLRLGRFATFQQFGGYFKAAVIDANLGLSSVANHELAAGGMATVRFFGLSRPFAIALDYSSLVFSQTDIALSLSTLSFSVGYAFF